MKTYILIPLAVLSCASVALSENKPYLLTTVLFYNDGKGHQIVAAGRIPTKVNTAIRNDIKGRLGTNTVRLVPLFRKIANSPAAKEITGFVKNKFEQVYSAEIPKWLASKVVHEKSKKMHLRNMKTTKLNDLAKDTQNNDEAVNTNSISGGKFDEISNNNIAKVPNNYYIPNTVVYAVENKCMTPTDYTCYN